MKKLTFLFTSILFLNLLFTDVQAQDQPTRHTRIETLDGNEFIGSVLEDTEQFIRVMTENLGEITIQKKDIKRLIELGELKSKDGTYWLSNPQATRYFWVPNAYSLKKGEGYYQNVWVLFNQAVYGFSDHFSGGIGLMPTFLFGGASTPAWLTLKFSVPVIENKLNMGGGMLAGMVIGESNSGFGIVYGISTIGSEDKNLNIGLGWAFAGGEIASTPTVNISGMIRISPKGYLLTENYFISTPDDFAAIMMLGGRRIIKRAGLDFGLAIPVGADIDSFVGIPWLGITIPF